MKLRECVVLHIFDLKIFNQNRIALDYYHLYMNGPNKLSRRIAILGYFTTKSKEKQIFLLLKIYIKKSKSLTNEDEEVNDKEMEIKKRRDK